MKKLSANIVIVMKMMGMCMCSMCMFCYGFFSNVLSIIRPEPCLYSTPLKQLITRRVHLKLSFFITVANMPQ